jgi:hypothetical protein
MQTDITKLAVLNKMRPMESNVKEICDEFHNGISLERANTCNTVGANETERSAIKNVESPVKSHKKQ